MEKVTLAVNGGEIVATLVNGVIICPVDELRRALNGLDAKVIRNHETVPGCALPEVGAARDGGIVSRRYSHPELGCGYETVAPL